MSEKQSKGDRVFVVVILFLFNCFAVLTVVQLLFQVLEVDFTVHGLDVFTIGLVISIFTTLLFVGLNDIISHLEDLKRGEDDGPEV